MSRRFHYYNVFVTLNNTATTLYFSDFLTLIEKIEWKNRIRKIKYHPTALFHVSIPGQDQTCRVAAIGKYRQTIKPYTGDINTNEANMIKNDIIEMVTMVVAPMARTVLVEYNFYGSKIKDIEDYFNSFLPMNNSNEQWAVRFVPVDSERSLADVRGSQEIKTIRLKMHVENTDFALLLDRSQKDKQNNSLFGGIVSLMNKIQEDTDAPVVDLSFGKGRKRKLQLNNAEILKVIELLDVNNNESVLSCYVEFKNPATGKYESIELKNVGVKNDLVLEGDKGNHGWEFVGDKILERYIEKGRQGSASTKKINYHLDNVQLPTLVSQASEKYFVSVQEGQREYMDNDSK